MQNWLKGQDDGCKKWSGNAQAPSSWREWLALWDYQAVAQVPISESVTLLCPFSLPGTHSPLLQWLSLRPLPLESLLRVWGSLGTCLLHSRVLAHRTCLEDICWEMMDTSRVFILVSKTKQTGDSFLHLSCPKFWLPCGLRLPLSAQCLAAPRGRDTPCPFPHSHGPFPSLLVHMAFSPDRNDSWKLVTECVCIFLSCTQHSVNDRTQTLLPLLKYLTLHLYFSIANSVFLSLTSGLGISP